MRDTTPIRTPRIRSAAPRRLARWAAPVVLGVAVAACGSSSVTEVESGLPPAAAFRSAATAEAARYVDLQVDRATAAGSDAAFRAASAAEAARYVDLQLDRAASVRS